MPFPPPLIYSQSFGFIVYKLGMAVNSVTYECECMSFTIGTLVLSKGPVSVFLTLKGHPVTQYTRVQGF
jgi:hypothetical protein